MHYGGELLCPFRASVSSITPILCCRSCRNGHVGVVKLLLAKCSVLGQRDLACRDHGCLRHAIINSHVAVVDVLLTRFPDTPVSALEACDGQAVQHVVRTRDAAMLAVLFQHFGRAAVLKVHRRSLANRLLQGPSTHVRQHPTDHDSSALEEPTDEITAVQEGAVQWMEAPLLTTDTHSIHEQNTADSTCPEPIAVLYPIGNRRVARLSFTIT